MRAPLVARRLLVLFAVHAIDARRLRIHRRHLAPSQPRGDARVRDAAVGRARAPRRQVDSALVRRPAARRCDRASARTRHLHDGIQLRRLGHRARGGVPCGRGAATWERDGQRERSHGRVNSHAQGAHWRGRGLGGPRAHAPRPNDPPSGRRARRHEAAAARAWRAACEPAAAGRRRGGIRAADGLLLVAGQAHPNHPLRVRARLRELDGDSPLHPLPPLLRRSRRGLRAARGAAGPDALALAAAAALHDDPHLGGAA